MDSNRLTLTEKNILNDASLLAYGSDIATDLHTFLGFDIGALILTHPHPSTLERRTECGLHIIASGLDFGDGWIKNMAVKKASSIVLAEQKDIRVNKPNSDEWQLLHDHGIIDKPRKDERSDKKYFYSVMSSIAIREAMNGNTKIAAVLGANIGISALRDKSKTDLRDYAEARDLPTNAKKWGKAKTLLHNVGIGIVLGSSEKNIVGKAIGCAVISAGTTVGLHDWRIYRRYIRLEKARAGEL